MKQAMRRFLNFAGGKTTEAVTASEHGRASVKITATDSQGGQIIISSGEIDDQAVPQLLQPDKPKSTAEWVGTMCFACRDVAGARPKDCFEAGAYLSELDHLKPFDPHRHSALLVLVQMIASDRIAREELRSVREHVPDIVLVAQECAGVSTFDEMLEGVLGSVFLEALVRLGRA